MSIGESLEEAIENSNPEVLKNLLESKLSSGKANNNRNTLAIYRILDYVYEPVVEKIRLFIDYGFDVNQKKSNNAYSILHKAVSYGKLKLVEVLLENGADVNERVNRYQRTPLHFSETPAITKQLIHYKAKFDLKDIEGNAPLNIFVRNPSSIYTEKIICEQIKLVLDAGADQNTINIDGATPLINALTFPLKKCVDILLEYNPDVNIRAANGNTPLHFSVSMGLEEITKKLIKRNADVNMLNPNDKWSPIFIAAFKGHVKIVKILLNAGAKKNLTDQDGKKPIDYTKNKEIIKLLH